MALVIENYSDLTQDQKNRLLALLNACLFQVDAIIDANGRVTLEPNQTDHGPPSPAHNAFQTALEQVLSHAQTTNLTVEDGDEHVEIDSYAGQRIDIADLEALGGNPHQESGLTAWGALIHAIVEQFYNQIFDLSYSWWWDEAAAGWKMGAHNHAIEAENGVEGGRRPQPLFNDPDITDDGDGRKRWRFCRYYNGTAKYFEVTFQDGDVVGPPAEVQRSVPPGGGATTPGGGLFGSGRGFFGRMEHVRRAVDSLVDILRNRRIDDFVEFAVAARLLEETTGLRANTVESLVGRTYTSWKVLEADVAAWTRWLDEESDSLTFDATTWQFRPKPELPEPTEKEPQPPRHRVKPGRSSKHE